MKILAVDPGYDRVGIAILKGEANIAELVHSECFLTERNDCRAKRLADISEKIGWILKKYKPEAVAVETLYFSVNQKTAIGVAEARGVIIAEAGKANKFVAELNPNTVKLAVTGYGNSKKKAVMDMAKKLLNLKKNIKYDDEYDAIAIGLAALAMSRTIFR